MPNVRTINVTSGNENIAAVCPALTLEFIILATTVAFIAMLFMAMNINQY